MIEQIKTKYKALEHKKSFVDQLAKDLNMSAIYLRQNWFQADWNIKPDKIEFVNDALDKRKEFEIKKAEMLKNLETAINE
jgi:hypoxanthine phosphoribosyltransferase